MRTVRERRKGCSGYFKCTDTRKVDMFCVQEEKKEARPWPLRVDTNRKRNSAGVTLSMCTVELQSVKSVMLNVVSACT